MVSKSITTNLIYIIIFLTASVARCQEKAEPEISFKVKDISIENLSNDQLIDCTTDLHIEKNIRDKNKMYSLRIPKNWMSEETHTDGNNGIIISKNSTSLDILGIVEISNDTLNLNQLFQKDFISAMKEETDIELIDAGTANLNGLNSYWIFHKSKMDGLNFWSFTYYLQNIKNNNFYLISTSVCSNNNDLTAHCELRQIVNTFQFID